MKAETVFYIAIHLPDYELQRLNDILVTELKCRTKRLVKKPTKKDIEMTKYLIKLCFSNYKDIET